MTLIQRLRHLFLTFLDGDYCLLHESGANTQPSACAIPEKLGMLDCSVSTVDCAEDSGSSMGLLTRGG